MTEQDNSNKNGFENLNELSKNSLVRFQYSCCGNNSHIDESEGIPIIPEKMEKAAHLEISIADISQQKAIVALLSGYNLPTIDLETGNRTFLTAMDDETLVGCVAIELYESAGILRSLAVHPEWKELGMGKKLTEAAEKWSAENGIEQLFLLTTTAARFFEKLNWQITDRANVPEQVAGSSEFASVCPSSATCMTKNVTTIK